MKNEQLVLAALSKIIDKDPIREITQTGISTLSVVTMSGVQKEITLSVDLGDIQSQIADMVGTDKAFEMGFNILTNRIDSLIKRVDVLSDVDIRSIVLSILEEFAFEDKIRDEINSQIKTLDENMSESVSSDIITAISNSIQKNIDSLMKKVSYYETTTNGSGQWSVSISGFASVEFVTPIAILESGSITNQPVAILHAYSNSDANGRVIESNGIALGGQGLEFSGSGVRVRVRVEGTYPATGVTW